MIEVNLEIQPIPKARPRATRTGRVYTPARTAEYERTIAKLVSHHSAQLGALALEVIFVLKRPNNRPKSKPQRFFKAGSRGDLDNYIKALLDGLQRGGVVPNDAAVVQIQAHKVYAALDELPHIELKLWSLGEEGVVLTAPPQPSPIEAQSTRDRSRARGPAVEP
jgi:Holliday junction resolvase RusA-like endonuclease